MSSNDSKLKKKYADRAKREASETKVTTKTTTKKNVKRIYLGKRGGKMMNLCKVQNGILPIRKPLTFTYKTYYKIDVPALQKSTTKFISLVSLLDPEYDNLGRNDSFGYYNKYMGATAGLYTKYKPYSVTFTIKAIPLTENTMPIIVYSATEVGSSDYPITVSAFKVAERPRASKQILEYLGDTEFKTKKFKMYLSQVFGATRDQYKNDSLYLRDYNTASSSAPWLAITVGDSTGADGAQSVQFQITYKIRTIIQDPVPVQP